MKLLHQTERMFAKRVSVSRAVVRMNLQKPYVFKLLRTR